MTRAEYKALRHSARIARRHPQRMIFLRHWYLRWREYLEPELLDAIHATNLMRVPR